MERRLSVFVALAICCFIFTIQMALSGHNSILESDSAFKETVMLHPSSNYHNPTNPLNVSTNSTPAENNVFIFYFVFIPPGVDHWDFLVAAQLKDLKETGLLEVASLNVIGATDPSSSTATEDMALLAGIVEEIAGNGATVAPRYGNRYEYWGLYPMWEKAMSQDVRQQEDSVFLYMHSKGMVNHGNITAASRAKTDGPLFKHVIEPWRDVLYRFKTVPELDKAGFAVTRGGYIYFNYIWVRSSYVTRLEAPVERPLSANAGGGGTSAKIDDVNRYYYEHWIAHTTDQRPTGTNGWSMVLEGFHIGVCFKIEATIAAHKANHKAKRKARLGDDGIFNCTDPKQSRLNATL